MPRARRGEFLRPELALEKGSPLTDRLVAEAAEHGRTLAAHIFEILKERERWLQGQRPRPLWLPEPGAYDDQLVQEMRELIDLIRHGRLNIAASSAETDRSPPTTDDEITSVPAAAASAGAVWARRRKSGG